MGPPGASLEVCRRLPSLSTPLKTATLNVVIELPYFDALLEGRAKKDPAALVFESFVHWGYWDKPGRAVCSAGEFAAAMERLNELVVVAAGVSSSQRVLDAGCGFGGTLDSINKRLEGMELTGVNIDPRQLVHARAQVRPRPGNRVEFVEADACALPFPDASFDRALAVECIFHFPSRLAFLKQAARVLKPGGLLALSDFVPGKMGRGGFIGSWIEKKIGEGYGGLGDNWRDGDYATMAKAAGLDLLQDNDITENTLPTYPFLLKLLRRDPLAAAKMLWPTRLLWWVSALGFVKYRVLAFRKPAT